MCLDESVPHQSLLVEMSVEVLQALCRPQFLLVLVLEDARTQVLEREEVSDAALLVQAHLGLHDVLLLDEQVSDVFLRELLLDQEVLLEPLHQPFLELREVFLLERFEFALEVGGTQTLLLHLVFH